MALSANNRFVTQYILIIYLQTTKPPLLTPGPGQPIKFCPAVKMRGIEWPRTTPGITRQALCPNNQEGGSEISFLSIDAQNIDNIKDK